MTVKGLYAAQFPDSDRTY